MSIPLKKSLYSINKLTFGNVSTIGFLIPLPLFLSFLIQVQDYLLKFHHVNNYSMERVVFHLGNPPRGVKTIKFVHIHFRNERPLLIIFEGWFFRTNGECALRDATFLEYFSDGISIWYRGSGLSFGKKQMYRYSTWTCIFFQWSHHILQAND